MGAPEPQRDDRGSSRFAKWITGKLGESFPLRRMMLKDVFVHKPEPAIRPVEGLAALPPSSVKNSEATSNGVGYSSVESLLPPGLRLDDLLRKVTNLVH